jgi:hypothetical protein
VRDIERYAGAPLDGTLPEHSGHASVGRFIEIARASLAPALGGQWRPDAVPA